MTVDKKNNILQKTVVIIDDKLLYREALAHLLRKNKIEIPAEFGFDRQLSDLPLNKPPNLFLVSPNVNDNRDILQVEDLIKHNPTIPVLLIVPPLGSQQALAIVRLGISGLILKTQEFHVLLKAIERVITGEVWFDRSLINSVISNINAFNEKIAPNNPLNALSRKEREIVELVENGLNTSAIAKKLHISEKTVRNHIYSIYSKLELKDRLSLANFARINQLKAS